MYLVGKLVILAIVCRLRLYRVTKCDGRTVDKRVCIEIGRAIMLYRRVVYPIGDIPGRSERGEALLCARPGREATRRGAFLSTLTLAR